MPHRLLFASIHSYLDPSSGAALATRELLELLAARGWDCRAPDLRRARLPERNTTRGRPGGDRTAATRPGRP